MQFPDWINNPWFVGIGGGILSGLAATWISRFVFSKRDNREYAQKVAATNREVIYSLRPGISEGVIPDSEIVDALIAATCRKYGVSEKDAYDIFDICEELIKEVMDSSFISSTTKIEFCTKLLKLQELPEAIVQAALADQRKADRPTTSSIQDIRSRLLAQMSIMIGFMVTILTIMLTFLKQRDPARPIGSIRDLSTPLIVLLAAIASMGMVFITRELFREGRRRTVELQTKKNEPNDDRDKTQKGS
jgi:hypothetical protein